MEDFETQNEVRSDVLKYCHRYSETVLELKSKKLKTLIGCITEEVRDKYTVQHTIVLS